MKLDAHQLVLVTGASGFIGGRIVELLVARGARVRVATSNFKNCSRIARFPVEMVKADLKDPASLAAAARGCSAIVHAAFSFEGNAADQLATNLTGTRALAEAALAAPGRRLVHLSSVASYGPPCDGDLSEATPARRSADGYSSAKLAIEDALLELHRHKGLAVTILQPTIVYGPFGGAWTARLIAQVKGHRFVLPRGGQGLCNDVYVDDVASAVLLALETPEAMTGKYLISGPAPSTWGEFYRAYESMLGLPGHVVPLDDAGYRTEERLQRRQSSLPHQARVFLSRRGPLRARLLNLPPPRWLLSAARALLPAATQSTLGRRYDALWTLPPEAPLPTLLPDPGNRELFSARQRVQIDRARADLGYTPVFDLQRGMALTAAWARWAHLLDP